MDCNPTVALEKGYFLRGFITAGRNPYRENIDLEPRDIDEYFTLKCKNGIITVCIDDYEIIECTIKPGYFSPNDPRLDELRNADDLLRFFGKMPDGVEIEAYATDAEFLIIYDILKLWIKYGCYPDLIHSSVSKRLLASRANLANPKASEYLERFYTFYALGGDINESIIPECYLSSALHMPKRERLYDVILIWKQHPNIDKGDYAYFYPCLVDTGSDITLCDPEIFEELGIFGEEIPFKAVIRDLDGSKLEVEGHRMRVFSVGIDCRCRYELGTEFIFYGVDGLRARIGVPILVGMDVINAIRDIYGTYETPSYDEILDFFSGDDGNNDLNYDEYDSEYDDKIDNDVDYYEDLESEPLILTITKSITGRSYIEFPAEARLIICRYLYDRISQNPDANPELLAKDILNKLNYAREMF